MHPIKPLSQEHRIEQFSHYEQAHPTSKLNETEAKVVKSVKENGAFQTENRISNYDKFQSLKERVGTQDAGVSVLTKNQLQKELASLKNLQNELASNELSLAALEAEMEGQPLGNFFSAILYKKFLIDKRAMFETLNNKIETVNALILKKSDQDITNSPLSHSPSSKTEFASIEEKFAAFYEVREEIENLRYPTFGNNDRTALQEELDNLELLQKKLNDASPSEEEVNHYVTKSLNFSEETLAEKIKSNEGNLAINIQLSQKAIPLESNKLANSLQEKIAVIKDQISFMDKAMELSKTKIR